MPLLPKLPIVAGESLTSYLNRVALFHLNIGLSDYLRFFEISQQDAMLPTSSTIEKISELTGVDGNDLQKMTARAGGKNVRYIGDQVVHPNFFHLSSRPLCPLCLLADGEPDSPSKGVFVGRSEWQIQFIRTCSVHNVALQEQKTHRYQDRFRFLPELWSKQIDLEVMASVAQHQQSSDLEHYIVDRINGATGPEWLDGQPMDLAAKACEMLGVVFAYGSDVNLNKVTNEQWSQAGHMGFGFASRGEEGIREGLAVVYDRHVARGQSGGPQKAFGRLYQWLQFGSQSKPRGDIRHAVRDFILDHFPLEAGANLFREPVKQQRVHSVSTLAKQSPFHVKTVQNAAEVAGLVSSPEEGGAIAQVFSVKKGEALIQKMIASMPMNALPDYLKCNRIQAEQLVRGGIIPRIFAESTVKSGVLTNVAISDVDAFLKRLVFKAEEVRAASDGAMDIISASQTTHVPVIDIIKGILSGSFRKVEILDQSLKFKGLFVDPAEIRMVLDVPPIKGFVWKSEAAGIIGIPVEGFSRLTKLRKSSGDLHFSERYVEREGLQARPMFSLGEIYAFKRQHILVNEYAAHLNVCMLRGGALIKKTGAEPIAPKKAFGRLIYRRSDVFPKGLNAFLLAEKSKQLKTRP